MAKPKPEEEKDEKKTNAAVANDDNQNNSVDTPDAPGDSVIVDPGNDEPPAETKTDAEEQNAIEKQQTTQTFEEVRLVDWPQEREGIHTIHTREGIFSFNNGKASFKPEVSQKLREAGYIE
ncbi:hypothetical protein [Paenibacillus odorifer]|uniref:hypothetical protein n=1 Tax=Paenibacillus odorifer TaxID=189426 RepID=UPI00096E098C|nr:hypothetical protein [Paenibacillus odorifer]OME55125.1 hypothetical protein BSK61_13740 [Paenibacillus odorifer]